MKITYFKNGKFYSLLNENDYFTHMLAIDGKIVFTSDEPIPLKRFEKRGNEIKIYDLENRTAIPSFCDAHIHFMYPVIHFDDIDLSKARTFKEVLTEINVFYNKILSSNSIRWLIGGGWDKNNWEDKSDDPSYNDLTNFEKIPIILFSKDYHSAWLNKKAIESLNVENPDKNLLNKLNIGGNQYFEGIKRDFSGKPTGIFNENSMRYLSETISIKQPIDEEIIIENIKKFVKILNKNGITAFTDCSSLYSDSPLRYLQKIPIDNLPIRCSISIPEDSLEQFISLGLYTGIGSDQLKIGGLKILYDGSLGSQTGLMLLPYEGTDNIGRANMEFNQLVKLTQRAISNQIGLTIHAIGDRATLDIANLFEIARNQDSRINLRMEHAQTLTDEAIEKMKYLKINVVMQPVHIDQDISSAHRYLKGRENLLYRFNSLIKNNINPAFSTDYPVAPLNPFLGIYAASTHSGFNLSKGVVLNKEESISLYQSIKSYTTYSHHYSLFKDSGILSEGFYSDFIVLDKDIFNLENLEEILDTKVIKTYFKGIEVYP